MLKSLHIKNYALIQEIKIEFEKGLVTITGETGAGKSIILGALALLTGNRAEQSHIIDKEKKCIVEGVFLVPKNLPINFFEINNLDCYPDIIIRREIQAGGLSRAFINDSPVNLNLLKELSNYIIDIHSQHENLLLKDNNFQLKVIDALARNKSLLNNYSKELKLYLTLKNDLTKLNNDANKTLADYDYYLFQYKQLEEINLTIGEIEQLENEQNLLSNAEEIVQAVNTTINMLDNENHSAINLLKDANNSIKNISKHLPQSQLWADRIEQCRIEIKDIIYDLTNCINSISIDPTKLELINTRLDSIYSLMHKHRLNTEEELIAYKNELLNKINNIESYENRISDLKLKIEEKDIILKQLSQEISKTRKQIIPNFRKQIINLLNSLGIANANFDVEIINSEEYTINGTDYINFLFSANLKSPLSDLRKVASGGEISRIMLCLKSLIVSEIDLPVIIFDEIDQGLSGEIAHKMGIMMKKMSKNNQVFAITHLPQIAACGNSHLLVYKQTDKMQTTTLLKKLDKEERINELARMLSGEKITKSAITNAIELMNV